MSTFNKGLLDQSGAIASWLIKLSMSWEHITIWHHQWPLVHCHRELWCVTNQLYWPRPGAKWTLSTLIYRMITLGIGRPRAPSNRLHQNRTHASCQHLIARRWTLTAKCMNRVHTLVKQPISIRSERNPHWQRLHRPHSCPAIIAHRATTAKH